jgi:hypothetical protein
MPRFYVFCGESEWKIDADRADIISGQLCFFNDKRVLTHAFNSEHWDVVELFEEVESL